MIEKRIAQLKRTLFDRGPSEGKDAALTISYRDAAQRAAEVGSGKDGPKKSLELMGWALQNGDIPLQKALLRVAFDSRNEEVVDAFIEGRSDRSDAANELWDLTDTSASGDFADLVFGIGNDHDTTRAPPWSRPRTRRPGRSLSTTKCRNTPPTRSETHSSRGDQLVAWATNNRPTNAESMIWFDVPDAGHRPFHPRAGAPRPLSRPRWTGAL